MILSKNPLNYLICLGLFVGAHLHAQHTSFDTAKLDADGLDEVLRLFELGQSTQTRKLWNQYIDSFDFYDGELNTQTTLVDTRTPGSKPRWETGYQSYSRPFSYDGAARVDQDLITQDTRLRLRRDDLLGQRNALVSESLEKTMPSLVQWTMEAVAHTLSLLESKKTNHESLCQKLNRQLRALLVLTGGRVPYGFEPSNALLLIYHLSIGQEWSKISCQNLPKHSWGLQSMAHPKVGQAEISRKTGQVTKAGQENFAEILGGHYTKNYDWIFIYDMKTLVTTSAYGVIRVQQGTGLHYVDGKKTSSQAKKNISDLIKEWSKRHANAVLK